MKQKKESLIDEKIFVIGKILKKIGELSFCC
jgi:hypothetical protein